MDRDTVLFSGLAAPESDKIAAYAELLREFVLEVSGYVCYTAFNGEDGLRLAKEIMPDLIILDVMMPKINGYKISRLLKYDNKYKDIPIIMVTARSQLEDKMIGEETGVNEYITKPFELDAIVKKVEEYLK